MKQFPSNFMLLFKILSPNFVKSDRANIFEVHFFKFSMQIWIKIIIFLSNKEVSYLQSTIYLNFFLVGADYDLKAFFV